MWFSVELLALPARMEQKLEELKVQLDVIFEVEK